MFLNISPIFDNQSPADVKILCCTHLPPSSLCLLGSTSKELHQITKDNTIWKQFYKQLYPNLDESTLDRMEVRTQFLAEMKELQPEADAVARLISNDTIASLICPSISLGRLKTMPLLDRSLLVLSGINTNSRKLFTKIAMTFGDYLKEQLKIIANEPPGPIDDKLLDTKPYQILHHLLETKRGPYKSKTVMQFMADTALLMSRYHASLETLRMQYEVLNKFPKLKISDR